MSMWAEVVRQAITTLNGEAAQFRQGLTMIEHCRNQLQALATDSPAPSGREVRLSHTAAPEGDSGWLGGVREAIMALDREAEQFRQSIAAAARCQSQLAAILAVPPEPERSQRIEASPDAEPNGEAPTVPDTIPLPSVCSGPAPEASSLSACPATAPLRPAWGSGRPIRKQSHLAALGLKRGALSGIILKLLADARGPVEAREVAAALVKDRIGEDHPSYAYVFDTFVPTALGRLAQQGRLVRHKKVRGRYQYSVLPAGGKRRL